jgi:hypothetical protein
MCVNVVPLGDVAGFQSWPGHEFDREEARRRKQV